MRVLVVEDDLASRLYLEGLLTKWGYHVTSVDDGERACEMLQQEDGPSLALLDWMLPGMDGVDICRRVRSRVRGRPVYLVLLTGRAQPSPSTTLSCGPGCGSGSGCSRWPGSCRSGSRSWCRHSAA